MNTKILASQISPLWQSQLARWLRQEDPDSAEDRGVETQERRAPQAPERPRPVFAPSPPPAWPRVFPGL